MAENKKKVILEVDESEFEEQQKKKDTIRVLAFSLADENYCVDISQVKEVVRIAQVTKFPNVPEFVIGAMNLRGEILSLVDIRYFFGLEQTGKTQSTRVVVTDVIGSLVGIVVDKMKGTLQIEEEAIQPPLATLRGKTSEYTKGQIHFDENILALLDLEKILKCEEIERLRKGE